jgi:hypothetical protein
MKAILLLPILAGCAASETARPNHFPITQMCLLASCTVQSREQVGTDLKGGAGEMQSTETTTVPMVPKK